MNRKTGWIFTVIFILLTLSVMGMIYYFSAENAEESTSTSNGVTAFLLKYLTRFDDLTTQEQNTYLTTFSFYVRKAAHFTEYFLLGLFVSLTVVCLRRMHRKGVGLAPLIPLVIGVVYAVLDEGHQLSVDGRAGQWTDVLIDSCGVLFSLIVVFLPFGIVSRKRR